MKGGGDTDSLKYHSRCSTGHCVAVHLGTFDSAEEAAQAHLQHHEDEHPALVKQLQEDGIASFRRGRKEGGEPFILRLPIDVDALIRSSRNVTGFTGLSKERGGRFHANCNLESCSVSTLGCWGTAEEASQSWLQHYEEEHEDVLKDKRAAIEIRKAQAPLVLRDIVEADLLKVDNNATGFKVRSLFSASSLLRTKLTLLLTWVQGSAEAQERQVHSHLLHRAVPEDPPAAALQWDVRHRRGGGAGVPSAQGGGTPCRAGEGQVEGAKGRPYGPSCH
jgi:hypothetical protein